MGEHTFRVLAALRELDEEQDQPPTTSDISTRAAVSIGVAERELNTLDAVGAAEELQDGEERFEPVDMAVEDIARRVDTLGELDTTQRTALLKALRRGDVYPPDVLYETDAAREAADRAAGSEHAD